MELTGTQWDEATLHALGATRVAEIRDEAGNLTGYDVSPDIDVSDASVAAGAAKAMAGQRQIAFARAMEFGNTITAKVTAAYSDVEARTWPLQRTQADTVLAGGDLPADALLRKLATRRNVDLKTFAGMVQTKAQQFEAIVDAGQELRIGAEGLLSTDLDTPAKLTAAVEALRTQVASAAAQFNLNV